MATGARRNGGVETPAVLDSMALMRLSGVPSIHLSGAEATAGAYSAWEIWRRQAESLWYKAS